MFKWIKSRKDVAACIETTWGPRGIFFGVRPRKLLPQCVITTGKQFNSYSKVIKRAVILHEFGHWLVHYSLVNTPSMSWYRVMPWAFPTRREYVRMCCVHEVLAWRVALGFIECTDEVWNVVAQSLSSYEVWTPKIQALVKKPLKVSRRSIVQAFQLLHKNWMNYKGEED